MPSYDPNFFNVDPYYDDFSESKKFLKLLFRPGFALQSRELSQIQSVLQNQIERFGNFIFDDGSMVYGGQVTEIPSFVCGLSGYTGGGGASVDLLKDSIVSVLDNTSGLTSYAKILYGFKDTTVSPNQDKIYYQFISGSPVTGDGASILGIYSGATFTATTNSTVQNGMVVHVDQGIRYTNGYFVMNDAQKLGLYEVKTDNTLKYDSPTTSVGFDVKKSVVTYEDDNSLRDPASGSYNFNAPGSDRFKIDLVISQRGITNSYDSIASDTFSRTDYIEFIRVLNGEVVKKEKYSDLGAIEETFARRTYDESGHYVVDSFEITTLTGDNSNTIKSKLDSGKAYIFGYEFETQGSVKLTHDKARDSRSVVEIPFGQPIGPFMLVQFSGISGGVSGFDFQSSKRPRLFLDKSNGTENESYAQKDGVRFNISEFIGPDVFVPGATLYVSPNLNSLTASNGASAQLFATIFKVNSFAQGTGSNQQYYTTIEVRPPYTYGPGPTGTTANFASGPTTAFLSSPFFVAGGTAFSSGISDIAYTGGQVSFFDTNPPQQFTGGSLKTQVGTVRGFNLQRLGGGVYKLFFSEQSLNSGYSLSDVKRFFAEGNTGNPVFFTTEIPAKVYNADSDSRVFETKFNEVVKSFDDMDFVLDIHQTHDNPGSTPITITVLNGAEQIGPNVSSNAAGTSISSSSFITVYDDAGELDGTYTLGPTNQNPTTLTLTFSRTPIGKVHTIVSQRFSSIVQRTKTTVTSSTLSLSFTGPAGARYSYFIDSNGNYLTDVYEITSVSGINSDYTLDNGQRNDYYDFSRIISRDPNAGNSASTAVVKYYSHSGRGPFVGGASGSYSNYENISEFMQKSGNKIQLRSSLDFRPVRYGTTLNSFALTGPYEQTSAVFDGYDHSSSYTYYLPRIDKIVLGRNKSFKVLKGNSSENPIAPPDQPDSMTLYSIVLNPYTFNEKDVTIKQEDNRRYTMKDIGNLEKRIESLEMYTKLSLLEQEAKNAPVYDDLGIELPKKAIFVDQFSSNNQGDLLNKDFSCSVDKESKQLRPFFDVDETSSSSFIVEGSLTSSNGVVTFSFSQLPYIENLFGNNSRKVNSNSIVDFNGSLSLSPIGDKWFSLTKDPFVKNNSDGENNAWLVESKSFKLNSNFWDYNWFGKETNNLESSYQKNTPRRTKSQSFESLKGDIGTFTNKLSMIENTKEKIVDKSVVPYCRSKSINYSVKGLKPQTRHYLFFDGNITDSSGMTSDQYGQLSGSFTIPANSYFTGKKLVRILDNQSGELDKCSSSADATYYASGVVRDRESQNYIRPLIVRREASNSENITNDALTREFQRSGTKSSKLKDSLSQIFTVDPQQFKDGMYVKKIDLFFDSYPSSGGSLGNVDFNLPVRLQLKPTNNGYPSPSKIIAESFVSDIGTNGTTTTIGDISCKRVSFNFDYPIYLLPGDYSVTVESNSDSYSLVTYVLPSTTNTLSEETEFNVVNPLLGSLFVPKNVGNYERSSNEFLTMVVHRCSFQNVTNPSNLSKSSSITTLNKINQIRSSPESIVPSSTTLSMVCGFESGASKTITLDKTLELDVNSNISSVSYSFQTSNEKVSPALDINTSSIVFGKYVMSQSLDLTEELKASPVTSSDKSRYMTKNISLLTPARNVRVMFEKNQPPDTRIDVFMKYIVPGSSTTIDDAPYVRLSPISSSRLTTNLEGFTTDEYTYRGFLPEFSVFAVKLVFVSTGINYPKVRNLKVIAT